MGKNFAIQTWLMAAQQNGIVEFWETCCTWAVDEWEITMTDDGDFVIGKDGINEKLERLSDLLKKIYG